jgi:K+-sensing histidine kinase KdpD
VTSVGVALPDNADVAQALVDRASELAQRLNGRWVAFVICNDAMPSRRARNALERAELVMRSGGTVYMCEGEDVAQTLLALAAREQIDVLILGAPAGSRLLRRFRPGIVDRVVRAARSFDVVVVGNGQRT